MSQVKVKICGLTNSKDAIMSCSSGADMIGFIFIKNTPRYVDVDTASMIISSIPDEFKADTQKVGLFKNEAIEKVKSTVETCGLDLIQLHGDEDPNYCRKLKEVLSGDIKIIKMFKVKDDIMVAYPYILEDYVDVDLFVFDTFHPEIDGGTGLKFNWKVLEENRTKIHKPFFIAGGLTPDNVREAIEEIDPYGVDISSGIEKDTGKKDEKLLKEFIQNAKKI